MQRNFRGADKNHIIVGRDDPISSNDHIRALTTLLPVYFCHTHELANGLIDVSERSCLGFGGTLQDVVLLARPVEPEFSLSNQLLPTRS